MILDNALTRVSAFFSLAPVLTSVCALYTPPTVVYIVSRGIAVEQLQIIPTAKTPTLQRASDLFTTVVLDDSHIFSILLPVITNQADTSYHMI